MADEHATSQDCPSDLAFADFLEGRLAAPEAERLRRHVAACTMCRAAQGGLATVDEPETGTREAIARGLFPEGAAAHAFGTVGRRYQLVRLLGEGGMGAVHEALHTGTGRTVALKLIHPRLRERGDGAEGRFRQEALAVGALHSPHLVEVLDAGEDEESGDLYLVMEHLRGEDLKRLLDRAGPLPPDVALRIAAQALVGLAKAHQAGIVHRDVKPANLFLAQGEEGEVTVKVLDFGVAKVTRGPLHAALTSGLTRSDTALGSPLYMSPEQMQDSKGVDPRTDLWSLGCTLYAMLTGRAPYSHVENPFELLTAIRETRPPRIRELAPWVRPEVEEAVSRALAADREARYASAAAMLDALRRLLPDGITLQKEMLVGAAVPSDHGRDVARAVDCLGETVPAPTQTPVKVRSGLAFALGAMAVLALGGVGFGLLRGQGEGVRPAASAPRVSTSSPVMTATATATASVVSPTASASAVPATPTGARPPRKAAAPSPAPAGKGKVPVAEPSGIF